jgi:hypothetical protein
VNGGSTPANVGERSKAAPSFADRQCPLVYRTVVTDFDSAAFDRERVKEHKRRARELGYELVVEEVTGLGAATHAAFAVPLQEATQPSHRRFLVHGTSSADAAMSGREVLEGIVELDWPWPDQELAHTRVLYLTEEELSLTSRPPRNDGGASGEGVREPRHPHPPTLSGEAFVADET